MVTLHFFFFLFRFFELDSRNRIVLAIFAQYLEHPRPLSFDEVRLNNH